MRVVPSVPRARAGGAFWVLGVVLAASAALADPETPTTSLIVKLRSEGAHAVLDCAEQRFSAGAPLAPVSADASDSLDRLQHELGVRAVRALFRRADGTSFAAQRRRLQSRLERHARRGAGAARGLAHVYRMELPPGSSPETAAARLAADPHVVYAQPNARVDLDLAAEETPPSAMPTPSAGAPLDDPFLQSSGTWGQSYRDQWGVFAVDAPSAWSQTRGEGVVVAVVDTGVDLEHPDLAGNLWVNPGEDLNGNGRVDPGERNGIDDDANGFVDDLQGYDFQAEDADPTDENGHGTHVSGIVAARGGNGLGIAGVAPEATLLPVRVFPAFGSATTDVVWRGVLYALENGADVVNASFSCGLVCRSNPVAEDVLAVAAELGAVFVTSAGNAGADVMLKSPERLRGSLVIGSIDPSDVLADSSSFGFLVDVVAPGVDVLSLAARAAPDFYASQRFVGSRYLRLSGTSMAAPHASGVVALLRAADPSLTPEAIRGLLRGSARDLGEPGHDRRFGAGRASAIEALAGRPPIDAFASLEAPLPGATLSARGGTTPVIGALGGGAIRRAALELGRGADPDTWEPLSEDLVPPLDGQALAALDLDALDDGAYVLRLRADAGADAPITEFAPLAIDRNVPVLVSRSDASAADPAIDRGRVVWTAAAGSASEQDGESDETAGLFSGRFGREGERLVAETAQPPDRLQASGRWLAWLSGTPTLQSPNDVMVCRLPRCEPWSVTPSEGRRITLQLSGDWLLWLDTARGLQGCQLKQGRRERAPACLPTSIGSDGVGAFDPQLTPASGPRAKSDPQAIWAVLDGGTGALRRCRFDERGCLEEQTLDIGAFVLPQPIGASGNRLVFTGLSLDLLVSGVFTCEIEDDGTCPPIHLPGVPQPEAGAFDIAGPWLAWHAPGPHGLADVFVCELDPARQQCPAQAVTRDGAPQRNVRVDRGRLVWEDQREGVQRIASFSLPRIGEIRSRRVWPWRWLRIDIAIHGERAATEIAAFLDGQPLDRRGGFLVRLSPSRARLYWKPRSRDIGEHRLEVRARLPSGLSSTRTATLAVRTLGRRAAKR